jgi:D-alanyl-lipoteichoic acid acyltransferase DltB (MBOAT superfamily)
MLFNSYIFIFVFLPITFVGYFLLNRYSTHHRAKIFIVLASLFFYSWWNIVYLPLILISIIFNFYIGNLLSQERSGRKTILIASIIANLSLLGYFKYSDFFIKNFNLLFDSSVNLLHLALPLAISFFTFQQIAYLVDSYRGETKEYDPIDYVTFVTFFPQLIAGPIVHHKEMMPQFADAKNQKLNTAYISRGILIFSIGLFKKAVIADTFAVWATNGFDHTETLSFVDGWITSLSYTLQLYYDFSGYTDMAIGAALLFNIKLPINFYSPYKALSIQDFWRRWHITLSRFLRDYIYIPLGGNRAGRIRTYANLFITFLIGGFWHGAGWTFIFWGVLHGLALVIHKIWNELGFKMNKILAWFITFNFINIAWVFFRAKEFEDALKVLRGMFGFEGVKLPDFLESKLAFLSQHGIEFSSSCCSDKFTYLVLFVFLFITLFCKNSVQWTNRFEPNFKTALASGLLFAISTLFLTRVSEFLYFNF